jgi:hypothetical protein
VTARKEDKVGNQAGLSSTRKEMLMSIQMEEDESWKDLVFYNVAVSSFEAFKTVSIFNKRADAGSRANVPGTILQKPGKPRMSDRYNDFSEWDRRSLTLRHSALYEIPLRNA